MVQPISIGEDSTLAEVPEDLLQKCQELLAREGFDAVKEAASKAMSSTQEAATPVAPICRKGHTLEKKKKGWSHTISGIKCDGCAGDAFCAGECWSCKVCDYDLCGICAAQVKCPGGHLLVKKATKLSDWMSGMVCDVCKQNPYHSGSAWSCRKCDHDECGKCMAEKSLSYKSSTPPTSVPSPATKSPTAASTAASESSDKPALPTQPESQATCPLPTLEIASGDVAVSEATPEIVEDKACQTPTNAEKKEETAEAEKPKTTGLGFFKWLQGEQVSKEGAEEPKEFEEQPSEVKEEAKEPPKVEALPEKVETESEVALIKKAREEALARRKAIEDRIAEEKAALDAEDQRLADYRQKLNEADKVRQRSESLRSAIELGKRDVQRLHGEAEYRKNMVERAEEAVQQALKEQAATAAALHAKQEYTRQLEQEMIEFLIQQGKEREAAEQNGEAHQSSADAGSTTQDSATANVNADAVVPSSTPS